MKNSNSNKAKGSLSRREVTKRSILALAAAGGAGLIGYGLFNTKKSELSAMYAGWVIVHI